jgi:hypothetical protein
LAWFNWVYHLFSQFLDDICFQEQVPWFAPHFYLLRLWMFSIVNWYHSTYELVKLIKCLKPAHHFLSDCKS